MKALVHSGPNAAAVLEVDPNVKGLAPGDRVGGECVVGRREMALEMGAAARDSDSNVKVRIRTTP